MCTAALKALGVVEERTGRPETKAELFIGERMVFYNRVGNDSRRCSWDNQCWRGHEISFATGAGKLKKLS